MEALTISPKESKVRRYVLAFVGLYFLSFCGYLMFAKAAVEQYHLLFFFALFGAFLALVLFLNNTLWVSGKALLRIDKEIIVSNIKGSKLKLEWVKVSKVSVSEFEIVFYTDGGRKEKALNLSGLTYADVPLVKEKVVEFCELKNIVCQK